MRYSLPVILSCVLLLSTGCTYDYVAETARVSIAQAGVTDQFQVERGGNFRFQPGTHVYVAVATPPLADPSSGAQELPWRLARLVNGAFAGPFVTSMGVDVATREVARALAANAGAALLIYPSLIPDGEVNDVWHRQTMAMQMEIYDVTTGRPVDRVVIHGRAAFAHSEIEEPALRAALGTLARNLVGGGAAADHRLEYLL